MRDSPEPSSDPPFVTVTEFWASVRAAFAGLAIGVLATGVVYVLGIPLGAWFLQPEPDGSPDRVLESWAGSLFFVSSFSIVAAAYWPNGGKTWLAVTLVLGLFLFGGLGALPLVKHFRYEMRDVDMSLPFGLVFGLVAWMFHQLKHHGSWPPHGRLLMLLRRVLLAPMVWVLLCTLFLRTCSPCNSGPRGAVEEVGNAYLRQAALHFVEYGEAPQNFRAMGIELPRQTRAGWRIRAWSDPFFVMLEYGDYTDCNWEVTGSLRASWNPIFEDDSGVECKEALSLLRLVLADWAEKGVFAGNMETLGLAEDWGDAGSWRIREAKVKDVRFDPPELLLERMVAGTAGVPRWEWVLKLRTVDWYHDT
ncbi:MAG: hypothetical protein ACPG31_01430 [Planctomycetota bacterium]